jgi:hypothetical protein
VTTSSYSSLIILPLTSYTCKSALCSPAIAAWFCQEYRYENIVSLSVWTSIICVRAVPITAATVRQALVIAHTTCSSYAETSHLSCSMCKCSGHSSLYHLPSSQHAARMQACRQDVNLRGSRALRRQRWPPSWALQQPTRHAVLQHAAHAQQPSGHQLPAGVMCKTQRGQRWGRQVPLAAR